MNKLLVALMASAFAFGSASVLADDSTMMPLSKMETQQAKAARAEAKAKWAKMTDAEKAAYRKSAAAKKQADLNAMEAVAQESQSSGANSPARAEAKANIDASKAQPKPTAQERQQYGTTMDKKASSGQ
jgi:hypothetical protein